ncbi:hypothetical protein DXG01_001251 [Tephrocybe rancida]|nr:hypothetical protein DXG01_001251 [Tephrocybe rancida]
MDLLFWGTIIVLLSQHFWLPLPTRAPRKHYRRSRNSLAHNSSTERLEPLASTSTNCEILSSAIPFWNDTDLVTDRLVSSAPTPPPIASQNNSSYRIIEVIRQTEVTPLHNYSVHLDEAVIRTIQQEVAAQLQNAHMRHISWGLLVIVASAFVHAISGAISVLTRGSSTGGAISARSAKLKSEQLEGALPPIPSADTPLPVMTSSTPGNAEQRQAPDTYFETPSIISLRPVTVPSQLEAPPPAHDSSASLDPPQMSEVARGKRRQQDLPCRKCRHRCSTHAPGVYRRTSCGEPSEAGPSSRIEEIPPSEDKSSESDSNLPVAVVGHSYDGNAEAGPSFEPLPPPETLYFHDECTTYGSGVTSSFLSDDWSLLALEALESRSRPSSDLPVEGDGYLEATADSVEDASSDESGNDQPESDVEEMN